MCKTHTFISVTPDCRVTYFQCIVCGKVIGAAQ